jgi:GMP synthase (glutamine-hydrolysing)
LGVRAERSPEKEIGVFPITLTQQGKNNTLLRDFPRDFLAIHWHNDMPGLTKEAIVLAYSEGCPRQIVKYTDLVYGFQCHLEITRAGIEQMIKECPDDLRESRFTQEREELITQDYELINKYMITILERLLA